MAQAEVATRYRSVAAGLLARVDHIPAEAWGLPSPCERWSVRDVVAHVAIVHRRVLARLYGGDVPGIEPPPAEPAEDLGSDLQALVAAVQEAVDDPARAGRTVESMIGAMLFADLVGTLLCADVLLHTWDVARATGQDESLDPAAVEAALSFLGPRDAELRQPEEFGPRLDPPPGADKQARLIAFSGRRL